jgi:hypothetical protein
MGERERRPREVWLIWLSHGMGYGALGLLLFNLFFCFLHPCIMLFWIALGFVVAALAVGLPASLRVRRMAARGELTAAAAKKPSSSFAVGFALVVLVMLALEFLAAHSLLCAHHRATPNMNVCLSNTKQLALALQMYVMYNNGAFPVADTWCDSLADYVTNDDVFRCPSASDPSCGYAYNRALAGVQLSQIADPESVVAVFESDSGWNAAGGASLLPSAPRHLERDSYGCADGSARRVKRAELATVVPDLRWSTAPPD